jgi:uncharacterized membrane protein YeaQ/YmgE (transglycosylase-associated protein family)
MFLVWIILGVVSGLVGSQVVNNQSSDVLSHIVLGVIGSFVGAFLYSHLGELLGSHFWSGFIGFIGTVGWLAGYYTIAGQGRTSSLNR